MSLYSRLIERFAPGYDPLEVEAILRCWFGTLDHLSRDSFKRVCVDAMAYIDENPDVAADLARMG